MYNLLLRLSEDLETTKKELQATKEQLNGTREILKIGKSSNFK